MQAFMLLPLPVERPDRAQLRRQVAHWTAAADRLQSYDVASSSPVWAALERELGIRVRDSLSAAVAHLLQEGDQLRAAINRDKDTADVRRRLLAFRRQYLRTETVVDFYSDAVNTRADPNVAALLRSADIIAGRSMSALLSQLGRPTPPVLTYLDKGLGASILKAGLRLWDGRTDNVAAIIKIVRHNIFRPTSLIHEAGHQVAHITGWSEDLVRAIDRRLGPAGTLWTGWASELAADAFAFAHTGYASVASLHDVLAGDDRMVFRFHPADPHPIGYLRVLLGVAMCRRFYGPGPWDDLGGVWRESYPPERAPRALRSALEKAETQLPDVVEILFFARIPAFGGRALAELIDPSRVSPEALSDLARRGGHALFTSTHWINAEPLRLLALTGFNIATRPAEVAAFVDQQDTWMRRLAGPAAAA